MYNIRGKRRVERQGRLIERLDLGLIYIFFLVVVLDLIYFLVLILVGLKNYYFWLFEFFYMFLCGQSQVIGYIGFNDNLKDRDFLLLCCLK